MADGYWDDMEEEKKKLFCSAFPCLFCLIFRCVHLGRKERYWVRLYSRSWVQVLLLLPFGMHICQPLNTYSICLIYKLLNRIKGHNEHGEL